MTMQEATRLADERYPLYTTVNPDPATGRKDCALTRRLKMLARADYIRKLMHEQTEVHKSAGQSD